MKRIFMFLKPYVWCIVLSTAASACCVVVEVSISHLLKVVVDMSVSGDFSAIRDLVVVGLFVIILGMTANYISIYITEYFGSHLVRDIRRDTIKHLTKVPVDYMERNGFGDVLGKLTMDIENIRGFMENYMKDCIYVPLMVIIFSAYLIYLNPVIYIVVMLSIIILVPLSTKKMAPIKMSQREYGKTLAKTNDNIQEVFLGSDVMKAFELETVLYQRYEKRLTESLVISNRNDKLQYAVEPLSYLIMKLPIVIVLAIGGYSTLKGRMTIGDLVAYITLLKLLIYPMVRAYQLWVNSKAAMASAERILTIFDEPCETRNITESTQRIRVKDDKVKREKIYELFDVSFSYDGVRNVLQQIDLSIYAGSKVAFVGMSGSGKSTLLKLLYGYCFSYEGLIILGGSDLKELQPGNIRERIALISQQSYLFPISIYDNIRVGNKDATRDEIINAAKLANCHEFIEKLPNGYESYIGENGAALSGGQIQRIAIARAMLKKADILLLDEPTSALDYDSEAFVNEAIDSISKTRSITVITIAHKLPSIKNYDEIIVLDSGCIMERGGHNELIRRKGMYANYYKAFV